MAVYFSNPIDAKQAAEIVALAISNYPAFDGRVDMYDGLKTVSTDMISDADRNEALFVLNLFRLKPVWQGYGLAQVGMEHYSKVKKAVSLVGQEIDCTPHAIQIRLTQTQTGDAIHFGWVGFDDEAARDRFSIAAARRDIEF